MKVGFIVMEVGGVGNAGGEEVRRQHAADDYPFPMVNVGIDTDPKTFSGSNVKGRFQLPITLNEEKISVLAGSPHRFGKQIESILDTVGDEIDPEELENGSKTKRWMTQLAFGFYEEQAAKVFAQAIDELVKLGGVNSIIPLIISSSGGGCGSAGQSLLHYRFGNVSYRRKLMLGYPISMLKRPVGIVIDPYSYAKTNPGRQTQKILSNCFALRKETDVLLQERKLQMVMHIGYANKHGSVIDSGRAMAQVLGTSTYQLMHNWEAIKGRLVDPEFGPYQGDDVPEKLLRRRGNHFGERE